MTGTHAACLHTNQSWSYLNHLVYMHVCVCPSQWPRGLRHELSSLARILGSWVRIPIKAWLFVCVHLFCVYVVLCVGSDFATG
jgi:hypothetical protein